MRVLFLGRGNDCRTLLAEAVFNHLAPPGCTAHRASCDRACPPDPAALALLEQQRIRPPPAPESPMSKEAIEDDVLITVCSVGAERTCPCCRQAGLRAHWGVHDPSHRRMRSPERDTELLNVYHILRARIQRFLDLIQAGPATDDPERLQRELTRIGRYLP